MTFSILENSNLCYDNANAKKEGVQMPKLLLVIVMVLASILLILIVVPGVAKLLFLKDAGEKVTSLLKNIDVEGTKVINLEDIKGFPAPVQTWLINSNVIGKEKVKTVRLKQVGRMKTTKNGNWMPTKAEQYFTVEEPGFEWLADVKMAPLVHLSGIDSFNDGKGKMKIKLLSIFPVVDAIGPEMDSGTLIRYLAEIMWFPTAALEPYITWQEIDKNSAKATITYNGVSASGVFYFNENGDVLRFVGKRYREVNGEFVLCDWGGINKEYKEFEGIRIPNKSDVTWFEEDGDFKWFEIEITELQYNVPFLY